MKQYLFLISKEMMCLQQLYWKKNFENTIWVKSVVMSLIHSIFKNVYCDNLQIINTVKILPLSTDIISLYPILIFRFIIIIIKFTEMDLAIPVK